MELLPYAIGLPKADMNTAKQQIDSDREIVINRLIDAPLAGLARMGGPERDRPLVGAVRFQDRRRPPRVQGWGGTFERLDAYLAESQ